MSPAKPDSRILIFDLSRHAHLPGYLRFLVGFWKDCVLTGELNILTWHTFFRAHRDVVDLAAEAPDRNVQFLSLTGEERRQKLVWEAGETGVAIEFHKLLKAGPKANYAALYDWQLFRRYVEQTKSTAGLIVHIDHYLPLMAAGVDAPAPFAGIYFAPTFHYGDFGAEPPEIRAQWLREKFVLSRALRHPRLHTLFFLDQFAAERARALPGGEKAVYLADPVNLAKPVPKRVAALKAELGIEPHRRIFLLFGHVTERKGVDEVLQAMSQLPPIIGEKICLLVAGTIAPDYRKTLEVEFTRLRAERPVQIATRFEFVPETDVAALFDLAHVVLAPYPAHAGMSGILLLAAAAGKPVLASKHGLMGEVTRRYRLGLAVDARAAEQIAAAIQRFATEDPIKFCDPLRMQALASEHHSDRFGATVFRSLGVYDPA